MYYALYISENSCKVIKVDYWLFPVMRNCCPSVNTGIILKRNKDTLSPPPLLWSIEKLSAHQFVAEDGRLKLKVVVIVI